MSSTKYKICSKCGAQMERHENVMTTLHPAQYIYDCPRCGSIEYDAILYPCDLGELATQSKNEVDLCDKTDYKKKYEATLQTAKQWIADGCSDTAKIALECVFPELRESEDERIRKFLINLVSTMNWRVGWPEDRIKEEKVKCLAWLEKKKEPEIASASTIMIPSCWEEKQKEQKPIEPSIDELQRHEDEFYNFKVFAAKQAREHHISFVHDFEWNNFCAELLSYFNEAQKPAEWSEEDEEMIKTIVGILERSSQVTTYEQRGGALVAAVGCSNKYQKEIEWLKFLRPQPKCLPGFDEMTPEEKMNHPLYLEGFDAGREVGKVETEQPKPADDIESAALNYADNFVGEYGDFDIYSEIVDAYKAGAYYGQLKQKPKWKPSEEQMNFLNFGIHALEEDGYDETAREIKELYEQLKKLMED